MKPIWLAGTALLALAALIPAAQAQRVNFTYTGKLVTYTVPATGLYQITAYGAQGGDAIYPVNTFGGATGPLDVWQLVRCRSGFDRCQQDKGRGGLRPTDHSPPAGQGTSAAKRAGCPSRDLFVLHAM